MRETPIHNSHFLIETFIFFEHFIKKKKEKKNVTSKTRFTVSKCTYSNSKCLKFTGVKFGVDKTKRQS